MTESEQNRIAIGNVMKQLMRSMPIEKITTNGILEIAGVSRRSFYRYFKDKYDLTQWMLFRDWDTALGIHGGIYSAAQLTSYLEIIRDRQLFYKRVYADEINSLLPKFIFGQEAARIRSLVMEHLGVQTLSETQELAVLYHVNGCIGTVIAWAHGGYRTPPQQLAGLHYAMLAALLRDMRAL